jgi:hypothetical protein
MKTHWSGTLPTKGSNSWSWPPLISRQTAAKLRKRFALGYARPAKLALCSATEARVRARQIITRRRGYISVTAPHFDPPAAGRPLQVCSAHWLYYGGPSPQMPAFLRRAEAAASA